LQGLFWVALGGAAGAVARWALNAAVTARVPGDFPWGTLAVNGLGSLLIGWLATVLAPGGELALLFMLGVCGSFTTVSSFGLQAVQLIDDGRGAVAALYVLISFTGCLGAAAFGLWLGGGL